MTDLYWETHPGDGPPMLLVHGFLSSRAQWLLNLEALGRVCTPVVVELWGHGRSPSPDDEHLYTPAGYTDAFEAIRTALGVERWLVCGYSLGAGLTIGYALSHPERIIAQVFTNSISGFADDEQIDAWRASAAKSSQNIIERGLDAIERIPVHPRFARRLPEVVKAPLIADAAMIEPHGIARTLLHTNPRVSVRNRVFENSVPALLTCGSNERRFQSHRDFAATHMPELEIADLDAGHAVNIEASDAFNAAVTAFVVRHVAG
jgi:pimeloyl-ACP methyl ester carboxylesterase